MTDMKNFIYNGMNVRTAVVNGESWFVAADICRILDIGNPSDALSRLDDDEKNTLVLTEGIPGNPEKRVVNEAGLYTLILRSRKPEARAFKRWVTHEVLPAIRKTGIYATEAILDNPDLAIAALTKLKEERNRARELAQINAAQQQQLAELRPKATYFDLVLQCRELVSTSTIAKDYGEYGVWITGISFDTDSTAWRKCVKKNEMAWTQLSELKKWKRGTKIDSLYNVKWIPTLYLIDPDGKVVLGTVEVKRLRATIDSLIQAGKITKFMMPEFKNVTKYIADNLHYPKTAQKAGVQGRVVVKFKVDKDGKVFSPEVSSESNYSVLPRKKHSNLSESEKTDVQVAIGALKQEALRVVQSMPAWKPAQVNGRNITISLRVPVRFALE